MFYLNVKSFTYFCTLEMINCKEFCYWKWKQTKTVIKIGKDIDVAWFMFAALLIEINFSGVFSDFSQIIYWTNKVVVNWLSICMVTKVPKISVRPNSSVRFRTKIEILPNFWFRGIFSRTKIEHFSAFSRNLSEHFGNSS